MKSFDFLEVLRKAEGEGGGRQKVEGGEGEEGRKRKRKTRKAGAKGSKG